MVPILPNPGLESHPYFPIVAVVQHPPTDGDLTLRQLSMLLLLAYAENDSERTVRYLAGQLNVLKPIATRAISALALHGMVKRRRDTADKRIIFADVLPKGMAFLKME